MKEKSKVQVIIFDEKTMSEVVLKTYTNLKSASTYFGLNMFRAIYVTIDGRTVLTTPAYTRMIEKYS